MEVDEALAKLGRYSKWHILSYCLLSLCAEFPGCWHMLSIVFIGGMPEYSCNMPENSTIPKKFKDGKWIDDGCREYVDLSIDNTTVECQNGTKYWGDFETTIVTDWELICGKGYLVELSQTIFVVGVMFGAMVFTYLGDICGRKYVHLVCQWVLIIVGTVTAFAFNYEFFLFLRFLTGALQQGIILTAFVQGCEMFPAEQRTFAGIGLNIVWAFAMMIQAGIAYFVRDWRKFQIIISLPAIWSIIGIWFFPESVPWLVANKRIDEAEDILKKAAKLNKVTMPEPIFARGTDSHDNQPEKEKKSLIQRIKGRVTPSKKVEKTPESAPKKENIITVLKNPKLRLYVFVMCSLWFVNSLVYFGLSLSTSALAGDRYINFFLSGLVELPAYIQCLFVLQRFGRRIPLCVYHIIAGLGLMITLAIPEKTSGGTDLRPAIIAFTMIGKFGITSSFGSIFLFTGELYPTNVRNTGMGMSSVAARIGGMLAPFSTLLARQVSWLPGIIFGVLCIIVGLMTLLLPETKGMPLPQDIEEMERWQQNQKKKLSKQTTEGNGTTSDTTV